MCINSVSLLSVECACFISPGYCISSAPPVTVQASRAGRRNIDSCFTPVLGREALLTPEVCFGTNQLPRISHFCQLFNSVQIYLFFFSLPVTISSTAEKGNFLKFL